MDVSTQDAAVVFSLVDAMGAGACCLTPDGTIVSLSSGFAVLAGLDPDTTLGHITAHLRELPPLDSLPARANESGPVVRRVGRDGIARELAPIWICASSSSAQSWLMLVDRSSLARFERRQARLDRDIQDLRAELEVRARNPERGIVRGMRDLAGRLDDAASRARRYGHALSVLRVAIELEVDGSVEDELLSCIRGVDDVGRVGEDGYAVLLPHTDLKGGKVVAERIRKRLDASDARSVAVGVAQLLGKESPAALVARADDACGRAREDGGGILLAVDVL